MAMSKFRRTVIKALGGLPIPEPVRQQMKMVGTGVQWVGSPDFRSTFRLDSVSQPDAEELTRSIALATSTYCFTATMYRANKVAEPPFYIAREKADGTGEDVVTDHDLIPLLSEPSPDFDMTDLLQRTEIYLLVSGAAAWLKQRDQAGRIVRFTPFSGDEIRTASDGDRIYGVFDLLTQNGNWSTFSPEDVVYFKEIHPTSWRKNLSRLDVALSQLDLGHQVNRTVRSFMRKAMFPGGVVSPDKDWDPDDDEWDAFRTTIEAWYGGPAAAGTPLVLQGGATFSRAAIPLKELLPSELLNRIEAAVASVYGVPPIVLGWLVGLQNSPWSQMAEARQSCYEETIIPRWHEITRKAGRQLLSSDERMAGMKLKFDKSDVAALRADDQARATVAATMREEWTVDERRAYTGQPPLGPEDPRSDQIGGGLTQLGELDPGQRGALRLLPLASVPVDWEAEALKALMAGEPLEWVMFDVNTKAAARTSWEPAVEKILRDQLRGIIGLANSHIREAKADSLDPDSTVDFINALAEWTKTHGERQISQGLYPLIQGTGTTGLKRAAAMVGLDFAVLEPHLLEYAKEEADFLASVMGETTGRKVAKIVQDRLKAGGLLGDLRKDLQQSAAFSRSRAKLVARTESTRAWNGAQRRSLSSYERSQDETTRVYKTWLSSRDDRVRDEHAILDGERHRIDEVYSNGLQEPGEPNCRCTQTFDLETIGGDGS